MQAKLQEGALVCGNCGGFVAQTQKITTLLNEHIVEEEDGTFWVRPSTQFDYCYEGTFCLVCNEEATNVEITN